MKPLLGPPDEAGGPSPPTASAAGGGGGAGGLAGQEQPCVEARHRQRHNETTGKWHKRHLWQWIQDNEYWECSPALSAPAAPMEAHQRHSWLLLYEFFDAVANNTVMSWMQQLRVRKRWVLAHLCDQLIGESNPKWQRAASIGASLPTAKVLWSEISIPLEESPADFHDCHTAIHWLLLLHLEGRLQSQKTASGLLSWNIGPHGYFNSVPHIESLMRESRDMICLQDLRVPRRLVPEIKNYLESTFPYKIFISTTRGHHTTSPKNGSRTGYLFSTMTALHTAVWRSATSFVLDSSPHRKGRKPKRPSPSGRSLCLQATRNNGEIVYIINLYQYTATHQDHQSYILERLNKWISDNRGKPIILLGDFNASPPVTPDGLTWVNAGTETPDGCVLLNADLAARLAISPNLSKGEWESIANADPACPLHLTSTTYTKVDTCYFKPVTLSTRSGYSLPLSAQLQQADQRLESFVSNLEGTWASPTGPTWKSWKNPKNSGGPKTATLDHAILWNLSAKSPAEIRWPCLPGTGIMEYDHAQVILLLDSPLFDKPGRPSFPVASVPRFDPVAFDKHKTLWKHQADSIVQSNPSVVPSPEDGATGQRLFASFLKEGTAMAKLARDLQHKEQQAVKRARERAPNRSKRQQVLRRGVMLRETALRDSSCSKPNSALSVATKRALAHSGLKHIPEGHARLLSKTPAWRDLLAHQIRRLRSERRKEDDRLRKQSYISVCRKHRWLFDHGVKGMRRVMGKMGSNTPLHEAQQLCPYGIEWVRNLACDNTSIDLWFRTHKPVDTEIALHVQQSSVSITTPTLSDMYVILSAFLPNAPPSTSDRPVLLQSSGPWTDQNLLAAVESFFQKNAYHPFATCHRCGMRGPIPITQRTAEHSDTGEAPPRVHINRTLHHLCPTCMQFTDFRHNKDSLRDMSFLVDRNIFKERVIPPGETLQGALTRTAFDRYLSRLASRKKHGPDDIPTEVLKFAPEPFQERLHLLVNQVLTSQYTLPSEAVMSEIVLLYKKGSPSLLENYRPIALLNSVYQLVAVIIADRLQCLTEKYGVLESSQYGFRWFRGVEMSAQKQQWLIKLASKQSGVLIRIDLDCRNAFNAASHACLFQILECFGVPDVHLLKDLYNKSSMSVLVEGRHTARVTMDTGTAQGSVLSPLLFDLFINALLRLLSSTGVTHGVHAAPGFNHLAFADDLSLYVGSEKDANTLLKAVYAFEAWSGLEVSIKKSFVTGAMYGSGARQRQLAARDCQATKQRRLALSERVPPIDKLVFEVTDGELATRPKQAPNRLRCPRCKISKSAHCFSLVSTNSDPICLECQGCWMPAGIQYHGTDLPVIPPEQPTRFLGIHSNMLGDCTEQISRVFQHSAEVIAFLLMSRLTPRQNLVLIKRSLPSFFRFSAGIVPWPFAEIRKLERLWIRAYKLAWNLSMSTASCLFVLPKSRGGLQYLTPLSVLYQTRWSHLERCCQYDDGNKALAQIEYNEAMDRFHCSNLLELQEEMALHSWEASLSNSFAHACFLASYLGIKVSWDPFPPDSIWSTKSEDLAAILLKGTSKLKLPGRKPQSLFSPLNMTDTSTLLVINGPEIVELYLRPVAGEVDKITLREVIAINFPRACSLHDLCHAVGLPSFSAAPPEPRHRISWSRATMSMRLRRKELENALTRQQPEDAELLLLLEGEGAFKSALPRLIKAGFTSLDTIPRQQSSLWSDQFSLRTPITPGVSQAEREKIDRWLNTRADKDWKSLRLGQAKQPILLTTPTVLQTSPPVAQPQLSSDVQRALCVISRCSTAEAAKAWWETFCRSTTPTLRRDCDGSLEDILCRINNIWESPTWKTDAMRLQASLGPMRIPLPSTRTPRAPLPPAGSVDPSQLGLSLVRRVHHHIQDQQAADKTAPDAFLFYCELSAPTYDRLRNLLSMPTQALFRELISGADLLRMKPNWFTMQKHSRANNSITTTNKLISPQGWWVRAIETVLVRKCLSCRHYHTSSTLDADNRLCLGCVDLGAQPRSRPGQHSWKQALLFRTAEPHLLETVAAGDTPLMEESIREALTEMQNLDRAWDKTIRNWLSDGSAVRPDAQDESAEEEYMTQEEAIRIYQQEISEPAMRRKRALGGNQKAEDPPIKTRKARRTGSTSPVPTSVPNPALSSDSPVREASPCLTVAELEKLPHAPLPLWEKAWNAELRRIYEEENPPRPAPVLPVLDPVKAYVFPPPPAWRCGWYTSSSLGYPLINDDFERDEHPAIREYITRRCFFQIQEDPNWPFYSAPEVQCDHTTPVLTKYLDPTRYHNDPDRPLLAVLRFRQAGSDPQNECAHCGTSDCIQESESTEEFARRFRKLFRCTLCHSHYHESCLSEPVTEPFYCPLCLVTPPSSSLEPRQLLGGKPWEEFSVPKHARDPNTLPDADIEGDNIWSIIKAPQQQGLIRVYPKSMVYDFQCGSTSIRVSEGIAMSLDPHSDIRLEGARWHLLSNTLGKTCDSQTFLTTIQTEIRVQLHNEKARSHMSYTWALLLAAQDLFQARCFQGDTMITAPPLFERAGRGSETYWDISDSSVTHHPTVFSLSSWPPSEDVQLQEELSHFRDWVVLTPPVKGTRFEGLLNTVGKRLHVGKGKLSRQKQWWRTGADICCTYTSSTECWIHKNASPDEAEISHLISELDSTEEHDVPLHYDTPITRLFFSGTESGLLGIDPRSAGIYAVDGSVKEGVMSAGVFRTCDTKRLGCVVGRSKEGSYSGRAEAGATALALEDAVDHDGLVIILQDAESVLTTIHSWVGEGLHPSLHTCSDGDIFFDILQMLHTRIHKGWPTILAKVKAHRGDPLNEQADRAAEAFRLTADSTPARWDSPSGRPTYAITSESKNEAPNVDTCPSYMTTTMKKNIRAQAALSSLKETSESTSRTAEFMLRESCSRDLLAKYLADESVPVQSTRRLLQCLTHQFPCAAHLYRCGLKDSPKCPHCPAEDEHLGHIQSRCLALQRPRIAAHHAIWRDLLQSLVQYSTERPETNGRDNTDGAQGPKWTFPTANFDHDHTEWNVKDILLHLHPDWNEDIILEKTRTYFEFRSNLVSTHLNSLQDSEFDTIKENGELNSCLRSTFLMLDPHGSLIPVPESSRLDLLRGFLRLRPDGLALCPSSKTVCVLEFTRAMDTQQDWERKKEKDKLDRYEYLLDFINTHSNGWNAKQINFTVGVKGSLSTSGDLSFMARLRQLGVINEADRERIRKKIVHTTLDMHDMMLKSYFAARNNKLRWQDHPCILETSRSLANQLYLHHVQCA